MLSAIQSFVDVAQQQAQPVTYTPIVFTANVARAAGGTGSTANTLRANIYAGSNVSIDWGDGNISNVSTAGTVTKTYANNTTLKTIQVSGTIGLGWIGNDGNRIIDVTSWGNSPVFSADRMFANCRGIVGFTATGQPNFSLGASTANMFNGARAFVGNTGSGNIASWDVSNVTNMSGMFAVDLVMNQPIGNWNVSNVTNMSQMFGSATSFNQPLANWNVSNVTNMSGMFASATAFNQNLGTWTPNNLVNSSFMFSSSGFNNGGNSSFAGWANTVKLDNMYAMFQSSTVFNQPVGEINVSNVSNMYGTFGYTTVFNNGGNTNINNWNTANVTTMAWMFYNTQAFNQPINNWNTSKVTSFNNMFAVSKVFDQPIGAWNTSNVTDAASMFYGQWVFNQDVGNWNVGNLVNAQSMFQQAYLFNNGGSNSINNWNTANITNPTNMFQEAWKFNQPVGNWNTAKFTQSWNMFNGANTFNQDLGNWETGNITDMSAMFRNATVFNQNLSGWCVTNIPTASVLFDSGATGWTLANSRPVWGTCPP